MKVLQFAFDSNMPQCIHIPHNYDNNFVVYTGTHDNNTVLGWYDNELNKYSLNRIALYTGSTIKRKNITETLMRLAYASTANLTIIPMQDLLELDAGSRMNNPSTKENNWIWRLLPKLVNSDIEKNLLTATKLYNRQ